MLAGVPSGAGQYRFVRVMPVLIFPGARCCVDFVLLHNSRSSPLGISRRAAKTEPKERGLHRYRILPRHEDTAEGVRAENPTDGAEVRWQPGRRCIVRQPPAADGCLVPVTGGRDESAGIAHCFARKRRAHVRN